MKRMKLSSEEMLEAWERAGKTTIDITWITFETTEKGSIVKVKPEVIAWAEEMQERLEEWSDDFVFTCDNWDEFPPESEI